MNVLNKILGMSLFSFCLCFAEETGMKAMKYELAPLKYDYNALEPYIDAETVRLHHDKHQATYVANLNAALETDPSFSAPECLKELLSDLGKVPEGMRTAVRNNGGGVWNHTFYWDTFSPDKSEPSPALAKAINDSFGSLDKMKEAVTNAAVKQFGSGWGWLTADADGRLYAEATPNQDAPFMGKAANASGRTPLIAIDVWEHAYYLKYKNLRADYAKSLWNIIDWKEISDRYAKATAK